MKSKFFLGIKSSIPIIIGYIPIGFAYGVLARENGLSIIETVLMSLLVFAGSAQFIAVGLINTGASSISVIIATFLINIRHLLMSASLVPFLKRFNPFSFPILAFGITDETYAVSLTNFQKNEAEPLFMLGLNLSSHCAWVTSSLLGAILGTLINNTDNLGFEFALPAMFICLLIFQIKRPILIIISIISAILSTVVCLTLPGNWNIILATIIAATVGVLIDNE